MREKDNFFYRVYADDLANVVEVDNADALLRLVDKANLCHVFK